MMYRADQIRLWPRLLTAATIDPILLETLKDLMQRGASLTTNQQGGLNLRPGTIPEAEYQEIRNSKLAPRGPKLSTILDRARGSAHPWFSSIAAAYNDLDGRCKRADADLRDAVAKRDDTKIRTITLKVLDRHYFANIIAQVLLIAGYVAYIDHAKRHFIAWQDLHGTAMAAGIPWDPSDTAWPIETPDGWIWIADTVITEPKPVNLGGDAGLRTLGPDDLAVTSSALIMALSPVADGAMKEAG